MYWANSFAPNVFLSLCFLAVPHTQRANVNQPLNYPDHLEMVCGQNLINRPIGAKRALMSC